VRYNAVARTRVGQSKTIEVRIMQFSPHGIVPSLCSFCDYVNVSGRTSAMASSKNEMGKPAIFELNASILGKRYEIVQSYY